MSYGFKVRRIRSRSQNAAPSETFYYARWKKHQERKDYIKSLSSTSRVILLVIFCLTLNLFGLLFSEASPYSVLYLDAIGTALAAMIGGMGVGAMVVLVTSIAGVGITGHLEYALFSYSNALCVFIWAYFPRSGTRALGADIFENRAIYGYRHFVSRIFLLGLATSVVASASNAIFQFYVLDVASIDGISEFNTSFGTIAAQNNIHVISRSISQMNLLSREFSISFFYYIISSFPSHFVDKTISTLAACVIIICLFDPPHFRNQRDRIIDRPFSDSQWWNRRILYIFVMLLFSIVTIRISMSSTLDALVVFVFLAVFAMIWMAGNFGSRSIDPYRKHGRRQPLFIGSSDGKIKIPYFKDAIEDTIKIVTFAFVALQFGSHAILQNSSIGENISKSPMIDMFWYTVILLTGFRYALMASLRSAERI